MLLVCSDIRMQLPVWYFEISRQSCHLHLQMTVACTIVFVKIQVIIIVIYLVFHRSTRVDIELVIR